MLQKPTTQCHGEGHHGPARRHLLSRTKSRKSMATGREPAPEDTRHKTLHVSSTPDTPRMWDRRTEATPLGLLELNLWSTAPDANGRPDGTTADQSFFCLCFSGAVWHRRGQRDHGRAGLGGQPGGHEGAAGKNGGGQWQKWAARDSGRFGECVHPRNSRELAMSLARVQENGGHHLTSLCHGHPRPCLHSRFPHTSLLSSSIYDVLVPGCNPSTWHVFSKRFRTLGSPNLCSLPRVGRPPGSSWLFHEGR